MEVSGSLSELLVYLEAAGRIWRRGMQEVFRPSEPRRVAVVAEEGRPAGEVAYRT
jgi:hypothetical protein